MDAAEGPCSFRAERFGVRRLCAAFGRGRAEKRQGTGPLQNPRNPGSGRWEARAGRSYCLGSERAKCSVRFGVIIV
jgi:hypothetical protein